MGELDVEGSTVLGVDTESHWLANGKLSAHQVNHGSWWDAVVVSGISEGKGKHSLLLKVGLVDTGEGTGDDGHASEMAGLESSVFTGRTLSVVPVTNDNPWDAAGLVGTGGGGDGVIFTSLEVLDAVALAVFGVDSTDEKVVGDVVKMTTVLEPGTGHYNGVSN